MDTFTAFMPLDRRLALAVNRPLPDRVQGAALFADISGFTPLTAVLAQELGPHRGAEELIRQLNRVYTDLIAQIHHYHGNVIHFSGDAIACWFDQSASEEYHPINLALACALELQKAMARLEAVRTPGGRQLTLALKVALAAGPARRFLVGAPDVYVIEVLAGATLDQMSSAEKMANQGEVIVAGDAVKGLVSLPTIDAWREDKAGARYAVISDLAQPVSPPPPLVVPEIPASLARPWLLPPVFARLQQASDEFLADLRPAVVMFVRFSGIDYDGDDAAGDKLDAFVRRTQAILDHYEGYLIQLTMGDKGSYLYITFGAPVAHENDAERAAACALELRALPDHLPFLQPLQIGVSRGLTHSGACGSPVRRTFSVMGNEVNISARLMMAAQPGQILLSSRVAEALGTAYDLEALPPVRLKGVTEPMPLWELRQHRAVAHLALAKRTIAPMVGRSAEREQLVTALDRLKNGRSSTLLIEGQPGIGKSRLVQELLELAEREEMLALVGVGDAIEQSTPYHAWQSVFNQLFADRAALVERITAVLDPSLHDLLPLLEVVLPLGLPETELTAQLTGEARQENTQRLLVALLETAVGLSGALRVRSANNPYLVLILEDAHWLDSASWSLLRRVQRQIQPLLLVIVTRPFAEGGRAPAFYTDLTELPTTQRIVLDMLPPETVNDLICQRLGVRWLPTAVADLIQSKAEGHPFFSEELAYALRDAGLIQIVDGECRLTGRPGELSAANFPNTIQGVITSRIDRLSPPQQLTVKVASVIGRIFTFILLHAIYPVPTGEEELRQHLDKLERLGITPLEAPPPNLAYIFKHLVTQEVVYNLMTYSQRQQLHQRTASWYEQTQGSDLGRFYPLLAYHWRAAGATEQAMAYYEKAGEKAFRDYANQEAIRFFTQALELGGEEVSSVQRAHWQQKLGEASYRLTFMEKSLSHYLTALELLERPLPPTVPRRAFGLIRELIRQMRNYRRAANRNGLPVPRSEQNALLEAARAYDGASEIYYNTGDFLTTFYCVMSALNLAERAGASPELVRGYANMCPTLGTVSLHNLANRYRERALAMAADLNDLPTSAYIQIPFSSYSLWIGDWERAEQEIGEALTIYSRLGDWRHWCVAAWLWPQVIQSKGDLGRARDLWAELYGVALSSQDTRHQVRSRGGQMFNFLALGQTAEAFACVDAVGVLLTDNPEMLPVEDRLWYAIRATRALHQGQWTEARALAHELLAAISRARFKFDLLEVLAAPAEVFLTLWAQGEAEASEARKGCQVLNQYARTYPFARPHALRLQARYAELSGRHYQAQKLRRKSQAQAAALGMAYEEKLTIEIDG